MITKLKDSNYNTRLEASDWRFSATIVGLKKYLEFTKADHNLTSEYLEFNDEDVTEEKYLLFAEKYFRESMHHCIAMDLIEDFPENLEDEEKKKKLREINDRLTMNTIMKKLFKVKFDGSNKEEIEKIINDNRLEIVKNTFKSGKSLYFNFCNDNMFLKEEGKICRVNGYSLDVGRKSKAAAYGMEKTALTFTDTKYFDFIPFAFSKSREAFFINGNADLEKLIALNLIDERKESDPLRSDLLKKTDDSTKRIKFDIEVIMKNRDKEYYETVFIRKEALKVLEKIDETCKESLKSVYKANQGNSFSSNEYINIQKYIVDSILNMVFLDDLVEFLFKEKNKDDNSGYRGYLIVNLIKINRLIYNKEEDMWRLYKQAEEDAREIKKKLAGKSSNKLRAYEQKLITAISVKDYDRVKEILLHLSSYTQTQIRVLVPLFENFEKNKNLAYSFINALGEKTTVISEKTKEEN